MSEATKRCPFCDEEIRANAIKCKHCGSFLTDSAGMAAFSKTAIRQALMARFEIIDEIGRGGMGVVYKAIQKNLNRPVALKVLPQHLIHQEDFLKRFHGEAQKAAQLNHKNIITVYDEGEEHGVHFISMEFIDGQNLKDIIVRNGPLPVMTMMQWIKPVVDALAYAHKKGMIHRDIKSPNILISKEGRPVLTDFGIARIMEDAQATRSAEASPLTRPGTILGTLQYMSPEQVQGMAIDGRSDIYSMGVVMYQCLTGELPFRGDTDWSAMHKITSEMPTPPRGIRTDIPPPMEAVVLRCMAKNVEDRYQNCDELLAALERIDEGGKTIRPIKIAPDESSQTAATLPIDWSVGEETQATEPPILLAPSVEPPPPGRKQIAIGAAVLVVLLTVVILFLVKGAGDMGAGWSDLPEADQKRVEKLLQTADTLYQNNNLLEPPGNNAWEKYQEVLAIHQNNGEAQHRLKLIHRDLIGKVNSRRERKDYAAAKSLLQRGLECFPADDSLKALDQRLNILQLEEQAHALAAQQKYISPPGENAYGLSAKLLELDPQNQAAQAIREEIKNRFLQEGERLTGAGQNPQAAKKYRQALDFFPGDAEISQRLKELVGAINIENALAEARELFEQKSWRKTWNKIVEILAVAPAEQAALDLKNQIFKALLSEAERLSQQGQYERALESYHLLKEFDSQWDTAAGEAMVNERWGDVLFGKRLYSEAIKKYQAANKPEKVKNTEAEKSKWLGIEFVFVPGGTFAMGDAFGDGEKDERPIHNVQLSGFQISKHEITFDQYDVFGQATTRRKPSDNGWGRGKRPVINVSWDDAKAFCIWLSERTGGKMRLPTEAEWEYAARASKLLKWAGTDNEAELNQYAWYGINSSGQTHPVGEKRPNGLGLFDMSGNAYEWCWDRYDEKYYRKSDPKDPLQSEGKKIVRRGGSAGNAKTSLRCSSRSASEPDEWKDFPTGFRVVWAN